MKLPILLEKNPPKPEFMKFRRTLHLTTMPPLDATQLQMRALVNGQQKKIRTPTEGDATLLLTYKDYEGAVTSIAEKEDGEEWCICQVQGAKSRKSMRLACGLDWRACFAEQIKKYALHHDAEVRRITMPHAHDITNLLESGNYEGALQAYGIVRSILGMQYSDRERKYVVDLSPTRRALHLILSHS